MSLTFWIAGAAAGLVLIAWLLMHSQRVRGWASDEPDKTWKPTGVKPMTPWHYDEQAAVGAARRAKRHSATGRRYQAITKPKAKHTADIVPMPKRRQG
jgi:hypothetical protein